MKNEIILNPIPLTTSLSICRATRVDKVNPQDLVVHHVSEFIERPARNYFQQKYKQLLKSSLLGPRQYYQELLTKQQKPIHHHDNRSTTTTWTQCVHRLNREYQLTLDALERTKQSFEPTQSKSRPTKVTFCLPTISKLSIESKKIFPSVRFLKPTETPSRSVHIPDLVLPKFDDEETTFTIDTIYTKPDEDQIVIVQENTTEEQFNAIRIPSPSKISLIPKRIPTNELTHSKTITPKTYSSTSRIKPPIVYEKPLINSICFVLPSTPSNLAKQKRANRVHLFNQKQSARTMLNSH